MNWISIVLGIAVFIVGGLVAYFSTKSSLTSMVSYLIAQAENTALTGSEKMAQVVAILYDKVPDIFKKILTKDTLEKIAQTIFDYMKEYAKTWAKNQEEANKVGE